MGPIRQLLFRRRLRQQNEDYILDLARETGMNDEQIGKALGENGADWGALIDILIAVIPSPAIKAILTILKELFSKI